jgi:hypothetical protein
MTKIEDREPIRAPINSEISGRYTFFILVIQPHSLEIEKTKIRRNILQQRALCQTLLRNKRCPWGGISEYQPVVEHRGAHQLVDAKLRFSTRATWKGYMVPGLTDGKDLIVSLVLNLNPASKVK